MGWVRNIRSFLIPPRAFIDKEGADKATEGLISIFDYYGAEQFVAEVLQMSPLISRENVTFAVPSFSPTK